MICFKSGESGAGSFKRKSVLLCQEIWIQQQNCSIVRSLWCHKLLYDTHFAEVINLAKGYFALSYWGGNERQCPPNGMTGRSKSWFPWKNWPCMFGHEYGQNSYLQNVDLQKRYFCWAHSVGLETKIIKIFTFIKSLPHLLLCTPLPLQIRYCHLRDKIAW